MGRVGESPRALVVVGAPRNGAPGELLFLLSPPLSISPTRAHPAVVVGQQSLHLADALLLDPTVLVLEDGELVLCVVWGF